ncbi:hypothetical protein HZS_6502 [Henneguya salminicola]|nr:hypothetical protein HZS_6502 [Henneguya salminicola]
MKTYIDNQIPVCDDKIDQKCLFNISTLGPCSIKPYGYTENHESMCIYMNINKIFNVFNIDTHFNSNRYIPIVCQAETLTDIRTLTTFPQMGISKIHLKYSAGDKSPPVLAAIQVPINVAKSVSCHLDSKKAPDFRVHSDYSKCKGAFQLIVS